jgi:hypothetical protein
VNWFEETEIYQSILRTGEVRQALKTVLLMGCSRFRAPPSEALTALEELTDVDQLEELAVRLPEASGWRELLGLDGWGQSPRAGKKGLGPAGSHPTIWEAVLELEINTVCKAILHKGRINEARKILLRVGRSRCGKPPPKVVTAVEALTDLNRLEELAVELLGTTSWKDLLGRRG